MTTPGEQVALKTQVPDPTTGKAVVTAPPAAVPASLPAASAPARIDIAGEYRKIQQATAAAPWDVDLRRTMVADLNRRLQAEEGLEPTPVESGEPSFLVERALEGYPDPKVQEEVGAHLEALTPLVVEAGIDVDSFDRLASFAMKTAQGMKPWDAKTEKWEPGMRFPLGCEDSPTACDKTLRHWWGGNYSANMETVVAALKGAPKILAHLKESGLIDDPSIVNAILLHATSGVDTVTATRPASEALFGRKFPAASKPEPARDAESDKAAAASIAAWAKGGGYWRG